MQKKRGGLVIPHASSLCLHQGNSSMDNQILFEIAKYVESSSGARGRLHEALASKESRCQRFLTSRKMIEIKISMREDLKHLRDKNIYRDEDSQVNFQQIHHKLERVLGPVCPRKHTYSVVKISPRIACLAKNLDFELRKKILQRAFRHHINPVRDSPYGLCVHRMCTTHMPERGEHVGAWQNLQIPAQDKLHSKNFCTHHDGAIKEEAPLNKNT